MNLKKLNILKTSSYLKKQLYNISETINKRKQEEIIKKDKNSKNRLNFNDTLFIRHAHSQFNKACQEYRIKHKISYNWQQLCRHSGFNDIVAYNPLYIDCPLTNKGVQQCYFTSQNINLNQIDIILVSPHQRALQTCQYILNYYKAHCKYPKKIPVIVQPLIAGSLWSSCDISNKVQQKIKTFPNFNFTKLSNLPDLWYICNLSIQDKQKVYNRINGLKLRNYKQKQTMVLQMLRNNQITQSSQILRRRSWLIKNELKQIKKKHCKFLLISHYYIIQYMNSRSFNQLDHKPLDDVDLKNCFPYYNNLQQLLNYK